MASPAYNSSTSQVEAARSEMQDYPHFRKKKKKLCWAEIVETLTWSSA